MVDLRKARFASLNQVISEAGGWTTSIAGADVVSFETLPGSTLPAELRAMGYEVEPEGEGQRILPAAIVETVITECSTVPIMVRHAGIGKVKRYTAYWRRL